LLLGLSALKFIEGKIEEATSCFTAGLGSVGFAYGIREGSETPKRRDRLYSEFEKKYPEFDIYRTVFEMKPQTKAFTGIGKETKVLAFLRDLDKDKEFKEKSVEDKILNRYGVKVRISKEPKEDFIGETIEETNHLNHIEEELEEVKTKRSELRKKHGGILDNFMNKIRKYSVFDVCYCKISGNCNGKEIEECYYKNDQDLPEPLFKEKVALDSISKNPKILELD